MSNCQTVPPHATVAPLDANDILEATGRELLRAAAANRRQLQERAQHQDAVQAKSQTRERRLRQQEVAARAQQRHAAAARDEKMPEYRGTATGATTGFVGGEAKGRCDQSALSDEVRDHNQTLLENGRLAGLVKTLEGKVTILEEERTKAQRLLVGALGGIGGVQMHPNGESLGGSGAVHRGQDPHWAHGLASGIRRLRDANATLRARVEDLEEFCDATFQAIHAALPETEYALGVLWYKSSVAAINALRERSATLHVHARLPYTPENYAALERAFGELGWTDGDPAPDDAPQATSDCDPGDCCATGDGDGGQSERNGR